MDKHAVWIVTLVPIVCGFLLALVWLFRSRARRSSKPIDETAILLSDSGNTNKPYVGLQNMANSPTQKAICSVKENYAEKSNYLPEFFSIDRNKINESMNDSDPSLEWINQCYRLILKFRVEELKWIIEISKLIFMIPNNSDVEMTKRYFITMVVVGQEFENIKKIKTEIKKFQNEIIFASKIPAFDSIRNVVIELQLFSIDRYARHRVRFEIVIHTDRIVSIHPQLELGNLVVDVGNIEKEADVMNKNEDISKNVLLIFTSIYSYKTGLVSIFVDQISPNMLAISRRYSELEIELHISLQVGERVLGSQKSQFIELGSPNSFANDKATIFPLNSEDLAEVHISFQISVKASLNIFKKSILFYLFSQPGRSHSVFQYDLLDLHLPKDIFYARNVVSSQLEEQKEMPIKDYMGR